MASPYKSSEVPMVYLNKGQFYPITLHAVDSSMCLNVTKVKVSLEAWVTAGRFHLFFPQLYLQRSPVASILCA